LFNVGHVFIVKDVKNLLFKKLKRRNQLRNRRKIVSSKNLSSQEISSFAGSQELGS